MYGGEESESEDRTASPQESRRPGETGAADANDDNPLLKLQSK